MVTGFSLLSIKITAFAKIGQFLQDYKDRQPKTVEKLQVIFALYRLFQ